MIPAKITEKTARMLASKIVKALVRTEEAGLIQATGLTVETKDSGITAIVLIGGDILKEHTVTGVQLIDTGGDVFYERDERIERREDAGASLRIDVFVRTEENDVQNATLG